jgi:hypothetical protein
MLPPVSIPANRIVGFQEAPPALQAATIERKPMAGLRRKADRLLLGTNNR